MLCTAFLVTACGGSAAQQLPPGEVGGTIGYGYWGNPARSEKAGRVVALFQDAHPGTQVEAQVADYFAYVERLTIRAAGRDMPCVTSLQSTFFAPYAMQGALLPLDDLVAQGAIDVSGIPAGVLESGRAGGRQYMVPTGSYVRPVAYNADLLAELGVPEPEPGWSWDEYVEWLRTIARELPGGTYASELEGATLMSLLSWVAGHGETFFSPTGLAFPRELLAEFFQLWLDLEREGVTIPPSMIADQIGSLERTPLARGISVVGTRDVPQLTITESALQGAGLGTSVGWASNPTAAGAESANVIGSNGLAIAADCDNVTTAAAYIDFFANDPAAVRAFESDNGVVPSAAAQEALLSDPATAPGVRRSVEILRELSSAGDIAAMTYPQGVTTLTNELRRLFEDLAFGRTDVDSAVESFFSEAERALS